MKYIRYLNITDQLPYLPNTYRVLSNILPIKDYWHAGLPPTNHGSKPDLEQAIPP